MTLGIDLQSYLRLLVKDSAEYDGFIDAVTINETYFFREEKHFRILHDYVLPELIRLPELTLSFWSAACSTGEEAVSIALTAEDALSDFPGRSFTVHASDLSAQALKVLKSGVYGANSFREDGRFFSTLVKERLIDTGAGKAVPKNIAERIIPFHFNLGNDSYSEVNQTFHVVFLRNTLLYMAEKTRFEVLGKIAGKLRENGFLFLSSTEIPLLSHPELTLGEKDGVYFFRKSQAGPAADSGALLRRLNEAIELAATSSQPPRKPDAAGTDEGTAKGSGLKTVPIEKVLQSAGRILRNPLYAAKDAEEHRAALQYLDAILRLTESDTAGATAALRNIGSGYSDNEVFRYLQGNLHLMLRDEKTAEDLFRKSLAKNPRFWPARFALGMLLKNRRDARSEREFALCAEHIEAYIESGGTTYRVLLEDFDAKYFLNICRKRLERIRSEE